MSEPFKIFKAHKMLDWLEYHVTEWATTQVTEHFGCSVEELLREQIDEVVDQYNELYEYDTMLALGLRNVISQWENEHEDYVL